VGDKVKKSNENGALSKKLGAVPAKKGKGLARKLGKSKKNTSTSKEIKNFFKNV